ncbi:MAG: hypothetical protein ACJAVT_000254 [Yoonia sp.]|jgi:hypothetical protein
MPAFMRKRVATTKLFSNAEIGLCSDPYLFLVSGAHYRSLADCNRSALRWQLA